MRLTIDGYLATGKVCKSKEGPKRYDVVLTIPFIGKENTEQALVDLGNCLIRKEEAQAF